MLYFCRFGRVASVELQQSGDIASTRLLPFVVMSHARSTAIVVAKAEGMAELVAAKILHPVRVSRCDATRVKRHEDRVGCYLAGAIELVFDVGLTTAVVTGTAVGVTGSMDDVDGVWDESSVGVYSGVAACIDHPHVYRLALFIPLLPSLVQSLGPVEFIGGAKVVHDFQSLGLSFRPLPPTRLDQVSTVLVVAFYLLSSDDTEIVFCGVLMQQVHRSVVNVGGGEYGGVYEQQAKKGDATAAG